MKKDKTVVVIFKKEDLIEKLGFSEEQSEKIIKYQKTLPILLGDENTKVNARDLWVQLGEPQGHFTDWMNRKVFQKGFERNKDYFIVRNQKEVIRKTEKNPKGGRPEKEYTLTLDTAKNVALMENTDIGRLTRDYYISMEKAIHNYIEWEKMRYPQKPVTNRIKKALYSKYIKIFKEKPKNDYFMTANMDMINLIAFGFRAGEINEYLNRPNDGKTREHLRTECLERLTFLLEQHEILIKRGFNFNTRERELVAMYKVKYGNELNPFNGKYYPISYNRPIWWDMENVV